MKIQLSDVISLERDKYQWVLSRCGSKSYHATLDQVVRKLLEGAACDAEVNSVKELVDTMREMHDNLVKKLIERVNDER